MSKELWAYEAMANRRKKLLSELKVGNAAAGRKLLSTALEALAKAISRTELNPADIETLDYLRTGLYDHLINGIAIDTALGIAQPQGGQPARAQYDKQEMCAAVTQLASQYKKEGCAQPITMAKEAVGRKYEISGKTVGAICGKIVIPKASDDAIEIDQSSAAH
jgi:hypothetical protein